MEFGSNSSSSLHEEQLKQNPNKLCVWLEKLILYFSDCKGPNIAKKKRIFVQPHYQESYGNYDSQNVFSPSQIMTNQYFILD